MYVLGGGRLLPIFTQTSGFVMNVLLGIPVHVRAGVQQNRVLESGFLRSEGESGSGVTHPRALWPLSPLEDHTLQLSFLLPYLPPPTHLSSQNRSHLGQAEATGVSRVCG